MSKPYTYWLGTIASPGLNGGLPLEFFRGPRKADAIKAATATMLIHHPKGEYDSVQLVPYKNGQRDWGTLSMRWVSTGGRKPKWRKGEGIR